MIPMKSPSDSPAWRLKKRVCLPPGAGGGWPAEFMWDFLAGESLICLYLNCETHLWTAYTPNGAAGSQIPILRALLPPEEIAFAFAAIRRGEYPDEPVWFD